MVLESLLTPSGALQRPWLAALAGFFAASIALLLGTWIFSDHASLVIVFLTVFALVPLFFEFIKQEELANVTLSSENAVLRQHSKALFSFVALFFGMSAGYALWYVLMQNGPQVFAVQGQTIATLSRAVTGHAINGGVYFVILINNLKVMIFCFLFALIYGFGALFILAWNASVIGVALGNFTQQHASTAISAGSHPLVAYVGGAAMSGVRYLVHGIPEVAAYCIGGLAGGVLSVALVSGHWSRSTMDRVLIDTSDLLLIGAGVLVVAAGIEAFVTPLLI